MRITSRVALPALGVVLLGALAMAGSALATHEHPRNSPNGAPSINASIVPVFKQCGTGANPTDGQHSPPLGVPSCLPPLPNTTNLSVGPASTGNTTISVRSDSSDVDLTGSATDVRTGSSPAGPLHSGTLGSVARIRFSDHYNCAGLGCTGPYTTPGTGTDTDFGPVPVTCASGNCSVTTSANAVLAGSVVPGKEAVVQVFRIRINDNFPTGTLFAQQGIYIP
jgi:hypothetical protein